MTAAEADRQRAARAGRRMLARGLPPGFLRWLDRLAEDHTDPEALYAWSGALAAIALELERAFRHSGAEVRDLILRLHDQISEGESPSAEPPFADFQPFLPWLKHHLKASGETPSPRMILMQWIDVVSERLTMRRYHRSDLPAHHAQALILAPARVLGIPIVAAASPGRPSDRPAGPSAIDVSLMLLRFTDLVDAARLAEQGKNRIEAPGPSDFGGFYGLSESVQPPSPEELESWIRDLREQAIRIGEELEPTSPGRPIAREIASVLDARLESGDWPEDFRWRTAEERDRPASLLRRWFGRR